MGLFDLEYFAIGSLPRPTAPAYGLGILAQFSGCLFYLDETKTASGRDAYNLAMLQDWTSLIAPAAQERLTLLLNHVLSRESVAYERLRPHQGATVLIEFTGRPAFLPGFIPAPPALALQITPAGLLERLPEIPSEPALRVQLDVSNPAALALGALSGERPKVEIQGDAALATDMSWLIENLRWDIEDDLAKWLGPAPAHELARMGKGIAAALGAVARSVSAMAGRGAA